MFLLCLNSQLPTVFAELRGKMRRRCLVASFVAGVSARSILQQLGRPTFEIIRPTVAREAVACCARCCMSHRSHCLCRRSGCVVCAEPTLVALCLRVLTEPRLLLAQDVDALRHGAGEDVGEVRCTVLT